MNHWWHDKTCFCDRCKQVAIARAKSLELEANPLAVDWSYDVQQYWYRIEYAYARVDATAIRNFMFGDSFSEFSLQSDKQANRARTATEVALRNAERVMIAVQLMPHRRKQTK